MIGSLGSFFMGVGAMARGMDRRQLGKVRRALARWFSREELLTLAFDLGLHHENLPTTLDSLTRELVAACDRQMRVEELLDLAQEVQPNQPWETVLPTSWLRRPIDDDPSPPPKGTLVASRQGTRYHRPDCHWVARIKPENRFYLSSPAAARAQGKLPCTQCRPPTS